MNDTLKLADEVDEVAKVYPDMAEVSAELRRLVAINAELVEALEDIFENGDCKYINRIANAALEKAKQ